MTQRIYLRAIKISPWQFWLMGLVGLSLTVALLIVAAGLFLILAPVALLADVFYRLGSKPSAPAGDPRIIDADYEIVKDARRDTLTPPKR